MTVRSYTLIHQPSGLSVARVARLDGWRAKGIGVIGMPTLPPGEGVWLPGVSVRFQFPAGDRMRRRV